MSNRKEKKIEKILIKALNGATDSTHGSIGYESLSHMNSCPQATT